ncbi:MULTISPECIES: hypothetical protein [Cohnella]|uniref:hypothetical protein n=1 Tax=Cohnella TaxID=329857 RepID=UPI0009B95124|nr:MULTISPECIES: hypothetical protein [Cohnella]MBN2980405.1 hypothetical protein [Cohnella algarum]
MLLGLQRFYRFSGWMAMLGAVIGAVVMVLHVEDIPAGLDELDTFLPTAVWTHVALYIGIPMLLVGLTGMFLRQASGIKWWGWIGYVLLFLSFYFDSAHSVLQMFDYPVLFGDIDTEEKLNEANEFVMNVQMGMPGTLFMGLSGPSLMLGTLLTGLAFYYGKGIPRGPAALTLILFVGMFVMFFAPNWLAMGILAAFYLHFAWYGALLAFERRLDGEAADSGLAV